MSLSCRIALTPEHERRLKCATRVSPRRRVLRAVAMDGVVSSKAKARPEPPPSDQQRLEQPLAVLALHRRDVILDAVAVSAKELLRSSDLQTSLPKVIAQLGQATGVDRAHIFAVDATTPEGRILEHCLWSAPGVPIIAELEMARELSLAKAGLGCWMPRLARGEIIVGQVREFEKPVRLLFERLGTQSVLVVPVFLDDFHGNSWWGMIGFDDCRGRRDWTSAEIDTVKTLAELVGAAVARTRGLQKLSDANRIVENSSTILYRLDPRAPFLLTFLSQNSRRYGYTAEDLRTEWQRLVHREDRPTIIANIRSLTEGKAEATRAEFRFKRPDGSWVWLEGNGYALRDGNGQLIAVEGILTDITERKSAARRRDAILQAVAMTAEALLRSSDLRQSLPSVVERLGCATGVDRVHIFEVDIGAGSNGGAILWHFVWSAPGISTPRRFKEANEPMAEVGLASWVPRLARGETITGHVRDFEEPARRLFEMGNVKSVLGVPVFVDNHWWGLIGFDDCRREREWSPAEIDAFKTLAELVSAAVARERNLRQLADANRIIENSPTVLYRLGPSAPYPLVFLSQNMARYGYDADELLSSPLRWPQLIEADDLPTIMADIKSMVEGKADFSRAEFRLKKPDGSYVWFDGEGRALRDDNGQLIGIEGILTDITGRKHSAAKIAALARIDSLTGLANRAAFLDRLQLAFSRARRGASTFAILYLDLDHFKDVNDTLGHPIGDALLQAVADRLKSCVRGTDLVARFGGDEFAVLQDDIADVGSVELLAAKIGETIAAPYSIGGNQVHTTASIGVVPYRDDVEGPDAIMMKADLALYRAKDEGRNQFRFHVAELDRQVHERVMIGEDLRLAIERNEFELFYQPQVELSSGWIVGLEALIRWNHSTRGLLLPALFIPIAETTGSILAIGNWVIEEACRQIGQWRDQKIVPAMVAVNLSAAQFKLASGLDRVIAEDLARYRIAPGQLELELTESVLMETTRKHSEALERLRRIGVRLAIDDFGTGYSSLDYLRSFPVSRLKIDRRFVEGVTTNPDDAKIVRATIGLAHELAIEVVAEGVQTAAQRDFLISAGCKLAQGNYFGEPMPVQQATALLRERLQPSIP